MLYIWKISKDKVKEKYLKTKHIKEEKDYILRPEYDSIIKYKCKEILCTSGRNMQDKEELEPLCHMGVTTLLT